MSAQKVRGALQTALEAMAGIVPAVTITSSSVASPTVITTATPHGIPVGATVLATITGHTGSTPALSGTYRATATGASTLTLQTNATTPANVTVTVGGTGGTFRAKLISYENAGFIPTALVPYERVTWRFAEPLNEEMNRYHMERGFMQVDGMWPLHGGAGAGIARAELLRSTFYRGAAFTQDGLTTTIERTPEIAAGMVDADRFMLPTRIRFFAHVTA